MKGSSGSFFRTRPNADTLSNSGSVKSEMIRSHTSRSAHEAAVFWALPVWDLLAARSFSTVGLAVWSRHSGQMP